MSSLFISYFLIIVAYLAGILISTTVFGNIFLREYIIPMYSLGEYFMRGIFFLFPIIMLFLSSLNFLNFKDENSKFKINLLKSFSLYAFFLFMYIFFNEITFYTVKNPNPLSVSDGMFWVNFVIYTLITFTILLFSLYMLQKKSKEAGFIIVLSVLFSAFLYSITIKKYFALNRVKSILYLKNDKKVEGKIIAEDDSFIYVLVNNKLQIINNKAVNLIELSKNN